MSALRRRRPVQLSLPFKAAARQGHCHERLRSSRASADPEAVRARAIEGARDRLLVVGLLFAVAFLIVTGRLVELSAGGIDPVQKMAAHDAWAVKRADIVDRNGVVLATSLPTASLYADPQEVLDPEDAAAKLHAIFPDLDEDLLLSRLQQNNRFVWIRRNLPPREQYAVNRLGLPGLNFREEERRVYPQGSAAAHVLGFADIDGRGLAGAERAFDERLNDGQPVQLSLDLRIQHILRDELAAAVREFDGVGGAGVVLDVDNGELLAMVSLPDFDPTNPAAADDDSRFNRVTQGVYEMGSTFKLFTAAMALDSGTTTLNGGYDASHPIRVARYTIRDYHAENRWLSVPEILVHSSNIGAAEMALDVGSPLQRIYLDRFGLLSPAAVELPEVGAPLAPPSDHWRDINTMTIGFGHGISVSPLQLATGVAAVVGGGEFRDPTVVRRDGVLPPAHRVISQETSKTMCALMRLIVLVGTGRNADVPGLRIGGKTGTAEKVVSGRYKRNARLSSFIGAFPIEKPRYIVLAMVDEPKGNARTHYYATGGWVAAPVVAKVAKRIAPLLGIKPVYPEADDGTKLAKATRDRQHKRQALFIAMKRAIADARGPTFVSN